MDVDLARCLNGKAHRPADLRQQFIVGSFKDGGMKCHIDLEIAFIIKLDFVLQNIFQPLAELSNLADFLLSGTLRRQFRRFGFNNCPHFSNFFQKS